MWIAFTELSKEQTEAVIAKFPDGALSDYDYYFSGDKQSALIRRPARSELGEGRYEAAVDALPFVSPPGGQSLLPGFVEQIVSVPRESIRPSPLNPRTTFSDSYLDKLGTAIRNNGLINALVVRPVSDGVGVLAGVMFEIVAGECRWRAMGPCGALPAIANVPVVVRELTDSVVMELMLVENMARLDLTPLEEMAAFARMLAQRTQAGEVLYTSLALANKIGVSEGYVRQRLALRKLSKQGREALVDGLISFACARVICGCPDAVAPLLEDEVLHPAKYAQWWNGGKTMNAEEALSAKQERYVRELRGTPFRLNDGALVPAHLGVAGERLDGGACSDCPWNTANQGNEEERTGRDAREATSSRPPRRVAGDNKLCTNPTCYQKKIDVHVAQALAKLKESGATVLTALEAKQVIYDDGRLQCNAPYVDLDAKLEREDRASNLEEKKCPTWGKICEGESSVPVVVAVDLKGNVHRLAERQLAVEAARLNGNEGFLSFQSGRGSSLQDADAREKRKKELEEARLKVETSRAVMGEIVSRVEASDNLPEDFWIGLLPLALRHAGNGGLNYFCSRRGIEKKPDVYQAARIFCESEMSANSRIAMVVELLLSQDFDCYKSASSSKTVPDSALALIEAYEIVVGEIEQRIKKAAKDKKKGKGSHEGTKDTKEKPQIEELQEKLIGVVAGKSFDDLVKEAAVILRKHEGKSGADAPTVHLLVRKLGIEDIDTALKVHDAAWDSMTPPPPPVVKGNKHVDWATGLLLQGEPLSLETIMASCEVPMDLAMEILSDATKAKRKSKGGAK